MRQTGHVCISHSSLFAAVFIHFVLQSTLLPSQLHLGHPPSHLLSFPSMYIFRSRVIKSAPEGMCLNRISLIPPCPHRAAKTQIRTSTCTKRGGAPKRANTGFFSLMNVHSEMIDKLFGLLVHANTLTCQASGSGPGTDVGSR